MKHTLSWFCIGAAALALCVGCDSSSEAPAASEAPAPVGHPPSDPAPPAAQGPVGVHATPGAAQAGPTAPHGARPVGSAGEGLRGTVRETMDAGGYTYMRIETAGGPVWVAAMQMSVSVGDTVDVSGGAPMADFHSRTLDRTFDSIVFASSASVEGADHAPAVPPPAVPRDAVLPPGHPDIGRAPAAAGR